MPAIGKLAYTIDELVDEGAGPGGPKRTKIYQDIKEGKLKARKAGRRTLILADDYRAYLQALPEAGAA
jgi:hypothetical protein